MYWLVRPALVAFALLAPVAAIYGQERNRLLIYANKYDFLLPHIKTSLENMEDNQTKNKLFEVTNLNLILANTESDRLLRNNINYLIPQKSFSPLKSSLTDSLLQQMINYEYFLLITENVLQDKIEFQLTLYQIMHSADGDNSFPMKNVFQPIAESNFFISLSSDNYLNMLENGLKKMIHNANQSPKFNYVLQGNYSYVSPKFLKAGVRDSLQIIVTDAFDGDTDKEQIRFRLQVRPRFNVSSTQMYYTTVSDGPYLFKLKFLTPGLYELVLTADDGVMKTADSMAVEVVSMPVIRVTSQPISITHTASLFGRKKKTSNRFGVFIEGGRLCDFNLRVRSEPEVDAFPYEMVRDTLRVARYNCDTSNSYIVTSGFIDAYGKAVEIFAEKDGVKTNVVRIPVEKQKFDGFIFNNGLSVSRQKNSEKLCDTCASREFNTHYFSAEFGIMAFITSFVAVDLSFGLPGIPKAVSTPGYLIRRNLVCNAGLVFTATTLTPSFVFTYGVSLSRKWANAKIAKLDSSNIYFREFVPPMQGVGLYFRAIRRKPITRSRGMIGGLFARIDGHSRQKGSFSYNLATYTIGFSCQIVYKQQRRKNVRN